MLCRYFGCDLCVFMFVRVRIAYFFVIRYILIVFRHFVFFFYRLLALICRTKLTRNIEKTHSSLNQKRNNVRRFSLYEMPSTSGCGPQPGRDKAGASASPSACLVKQTRRLWTLSHIFWAHARTRALAHVYPAHMHAHTFPCPVDSLANLLLLLMSISSSRYFSVFSSV